LANNMSMTQKISIINYSLAELDLISTLNTVILMMKETIYCSKEGELCILKTENVPVEFVETTIQKTSK
jgi:hypothetical protein